MAETCPQCGHNPGRDHLRMKEVIVARDAQIQELLSPMVRAKMLQPTVLQLSESESTAALAAKVVALQAENARLQAIVDKVPKTADGVSVPDSRCLYCLQGHKVGRGLGPHYMCNKSPCNQHSYRDYNGTVKRFETAKRYAIWECYSTREAAEAVGD